MDFFFTFSSYEEENLTRRIGILEFVTKESEKFEKKKKLRGEWNKGLEKLKFKG